MHDVNRTVSVCVTQAVRWYAWYCMQRERRWQRLSHVEVWACGGAEERLGAKLTQGSVDLIHDIQGRGLVVM